MSLPNEAHDPLRAALRDFLARHREAPADPGDLRQWWKALAGLGVFSLAVPAEQDGLGLGVEASALAFEELGRALSPGPLVWAQLAALAVHGLADGHLIVTGSDLAARPEDDPVLVEHLAAADKVLVLDGGRVLLCDKDAIEYTELARPLDPATPVAPARRPDQGRARGRCRDGGAPSPHRDAAVRRASPGPQRRGAANGDRVRQAAGAVRPAHRHFQAVKHLLADMYVRTRPGARGPLRRGRTRDGGLGRAAERTSRSAKLLAGDAADGNAAPPSRCSAAWASPGRCRRTTAQAGMGARALVRHRRRARAPRRPRPGGARMSTGDRPPSGDPPTRPRRRTDDLRIQPARTSATRSTRRRPPADRRCSRRRPLDESLRAILLTAAGDDFCSGSDWVSPERATGRAGPGTASLRPAPPLQAPPPDRAAPEVQLPVVCAVRGWAAGLGCQLALAADFTVAADDATFWEPFVRRGFTPDSGATWLLPRLVGVARAKEHAPARREAVRRAEAAEWGLIHRAVPDGRARRRRRGARRAARRRADRRPRADEAAASTALAGVPLARGHGRRAFGLELASRTADFREGLAAFKDRRRPTSPGDR